MYRIIDYIVCVWPRREEQEPLLWECVAEYFFFNLDLYFNFHVTIDLDIQKLNYLFSCRRQTFSNDVY